MDNKSNLPSDTINLAVKTLKLLIDNAIKYDIPPSDFMEYTSLFEATLRIVAADIIKQIDNIHSDLPEYLTIDIDELSV